MIPTIILFAAMLSAADAPALENAIPLHAPGGWEIDVGPGIAVMENGDITLADPVRLSVPVPEAVEIAGEAHTLPLFEEQAGGWRKGARLKALIAQECTATGLLRPESVTVRPAAGGTPYTLGADYALDGLWATVGRLEGGAIADGEPVLIDYTYAPARLDSVVVNEVGQVRLLAGTPGLGFDAPPEGHDGERRIGSVWIPGSTAELGPENLFAVDFLITDETPPEYYVAEQLLPHTLAKLQAGDPVNIVAWGDSVTNGGGVGGDTALWYQHQFHRRLQARYPKSEITLITAAWPGRGSKDYIEAPAGGDYDFQRDVLDPEPDLVTLEWVNDAYLTGEALTEHYAMIVERLRSAGAEVLILTPHLVRPDWMGVTSLKFDRDPRPYVQDLYRFAQAHEVALADGAQRWCDLWRQGIPYTTLLANAINHPDARGHALLADALMAVFPE